MRERFSATLIFAVFGALTVLAGMVVYGVRNDEMLTHSMPFAALSAAITGQMFITRIIRATVGKAALRGVCAMLLAQIPFTAILLIYLAVETGRPASIADVFDLAGVALIGGWVMAGPFQAVTGALAGLTVRHVAGKQRPHEITG